VPRDATENGRGGGEGDCKEDERHSERETDTAKKKRNIHGCHLEAGALAVGATEGAAE